MAHRRFELISILSSFVDSLLTSSATGCGGLLSHLWWLVEMEIMYLKRAPPNGILTIELRGDLIQNRPTEVMEESDNKNRDLRQIYALSNQYLQFMPSDKRLTESTTDNESSVQSPKTESRTAQHISALIMIVTSKVIWSGFLGIRHFATNYRGKRFTKFFTMITVIVVAVEKYKFNHSTYKTIILYGTTM
jgi:hypothetical protein